MRREELTERSPIRLLDRSIHGGLGRGNLGVVIARPGIGKTAFLVGVAMDVLMRGGKVLHVSLDQTMDQVRHYYDDIFMELAHSQSLEDVWRARAEIERDRRIVCYLEDTFTIGKLAQAVSFWKEHGDFVPAMIVVEGFEFAAVQESDLVELRETASACDAELWMSAVTTRSAERNERGIPEPLAHIEGRLDVVLSMAHDGQGVHVALHKDHDSAQVPDLKLALDPRTMLIIKE
jgi:hypothetical protein